MTEKSETSIKETAISWFVRLHDEDVSEADRSAFADWLGSNRAHTEAYREMEQLWSNLDQLEPVAARQQTGVREVGLRSEPPTPKRRPRLRQLAFAASVLIALGFGADNLVSRGFLAEHRTAAGEQSAIDLDEKSRLHLNTASAVTTSFTDRQRRVSLIAGEVFFEVTSDPQRPFIIDTAFGKVEVLGTAFSLKQTDSHLDIVVSESKVKVSTAGGETSLVTAGQGVRVKKSGIGPVKPADVGRALAWQRGRLVFDNRRLGDVLDEIERYRFGSILVMDASVANLPVTGSFAIDDTDRVLDRIEETLPVRVQRISQLLVLVSAP